MISRFNDDVSGAIIRAHGKGDIHLLRDLYIQRNALGADLDAPVYRIMEWDHFLGDLRQNCLTYMRIDKIGWQDSSENPLLNRKFYDPVSGEYLTLNGVVEGVYGSCWSSTASDGKEWAVFSRNNPCLRVQSTPRKLLDAAMCRRNRYYMLRHFIGRMQYADATEIEAYFSDPNWEKHLDGLGQGLAASFLCLSEDLEDEDEVRLLYSHSADLWSRRHVRIHTTFASVPFDWQLAIDGVVVGPLVPNGGEASMRTELTQRGIRCPVTSSGRRTGVG